MMYIDNFRMRWIITMWSYIIPIVTLLIGGVGGFFVGVYYLRKQLENMQNNPEARAGASFEALE